MRLPLHRQQMPQPQALLQAVLLEQPQEQRAKKAIPALWVRRVNREQKVNAESKERAVM